MLATNLGPCLVPTLVEGEVRGIGMDAEDTQFQNSYSSNSQLLTAPQVTVREEDGFISVQNNKGAWTVNMKLFPVAGGLPS